MGPKSTQVQQNSSGPHEVAFKSYYIISAYRKQTKKTPAYQISSPTDATPNFSHMLGQKLSFHVMKSSSILTQFHTQNFAEKAPLNSIDNRQI